MVREIAGHLEQHYEAALAAGSPEPLAFSGAMGQLGLGRALARKLTNAREDMFTTTPLKRRVLWPGMLALILSGMPFLTAHFLHVRGQWVWPLRTNGVESSALVFYWPWLVTLPFIGAAAAWLARRGGASILQRLLVAIFPALLDAALFALALLASFIFDRHVPLAVKLSSVVVQSIPWIAVPALCGAIGALPFMADEAQAGSISSKAAHA